jgi:CHAT domain-containing protein
MVEPYLRFLQLRDGNEFRGARAGRLLFDLLVGPFAGRLREGPRRIIVVPEGRLTYLPFEALVASGGDGIRPVFWGESAEISYAPSATRAVGGRPWNAAGARAAGSASGILAVGNSDGIRCDNRSRRLKRFFLPLAHVGREIRALAGYFQALKVTTLIDEEASEAGLRSADLSRYGILHLAAHGVIDDTDWWRSALLLRPDPERGDDGFFTALEISELELGASLVVLSGCGTGAGSLHKGEGIRGLSGAFLRAGAEYLVVSLWNVDDRATADLMGRFYRELAAGASPARALAAAKKQMIGTGYRNPFFWAPFVLIKNGEDPGRGREGTLPTALLIR